MTKILDLLVFLSCMQEIGVRPCGLNPKTSVDLYRKVVVSTVLYGCEVWNNLKQRDVDELNKFQRIVAKKIQGFHRFVRTDMCESMLGLLRLQEEIETSFSTISVRHALKVGAK